MVGGSALVALAVAIRGVVGVALGVGGIVLIARGATGESLGKAARRAVRRLRTGIEDERVNLASWESFPASDPPAHSPSKS